MILKLSAPSTHASTTATRRDSVGPPRLEFASDMIEVQTRSSSISLKHPVRVLIQVFEFRALLTTDHQQGLAVVWPSGCNQESDGSCDFSKSKAATKFFSELAELMTTTVIYQFCLNTRGWASVTVLPKRLLREGAVRIDPGESSTDSPLFELNRQNSAAWLLPCDVANTSFVTIDLHTATCNSPSETRIDSGPWA